MEEVSTLFKVMVVLMAISSFTLTVLAAVLVINVIKSINKMMKDREKNKLI